MFMSVMCSEHFSGIIQLLKSPRDSETGGKKVLCKMKAFVLVGLHDCQPHCMSSVCQTKNFSFGVKRKRYHLSAWKR